MSTRLALRHLLRIDDLARAQIVMLLNRAEALLPQAGTRSRRGEALRGRTVANLFFEASTRTRGSFEIAAQRLGADVLNLNVTTSSRSKGEDDVDTALTLAAMGVSVFVLRTGVAGLPARVAAALGDDAGVLNAGEAEIAHPTQGLLDALTIRLRFPQLDRLSVAIVGDIAHSRVARSALRALRALGVPDIRLVGPEPFLPDAAEFPGIGRSTDLDEGIAGAQVVMALRIQRERMQTAQVPRPEDYFARYGLNEARIARAAPDAIVMHPGPINRGVEIDSILADGPRSVIREQVRNGVAVRMAVLEAVAHSFEPAAATAASLA